jgi:uncharacterized protein with HEPN domain
MRRDVLKLLEDVRVAATSIQEYTRGLTEAGYLANKPIRRAVEREFEIIGEALRRLAGRHPDVSASLPQVGRIIGFRNILAHGYDAVLDERVWNSVTAEIPVLLAEVRALIEEERQRP